VNDPSTGSIADPEIVLLDSGRARGRIETCPAMAILGDEDDWPSLIVVSMTLTAAMAAKL